MGTRERLSRIQSSSMESLKQTLKPLKALDPQAPGTPSAKLLKPQAYLTKRETSDPFKRENAVKKESAKLR